MKFYILYLVLSNGQLLDTNSQFVTLTRCEDVGEYMVEKGTQGAKGYVCTKTVPKESSRLAQ